jgi:hypothetical protein
MNKLGTRLKERITRSAFFFGAVLFHLVLFLMVLGYIIFPAPPAAEKDNGFGPNPPLPKPRVQVAKTVPTDSGAQAAAAHMSELTSNIPIPGATIAPMSPSDPFDKGQDLNPGAIVGHDVGPPTPITPAQIQGGSMVDLPGVEHTIEGWHPNGNSTKFVVPIYLAKYADGDWDCNSYLHDNQLASGCLPNLMAKIKEWSNGEIEGRDLQVVALDSPKILSDPPPFIFFTGHKDFHLTTDEVTNLRKYLQIGGCIWGDSAFAGDGSRFDVAFHREMKRVLSDADLNFQPLPSDHDIFTRSRFHFDSLPTGMNRHADPVEYINLGDKLAILYTPNDYSDMMTMLLLPGRNESEAQMDGWNHWTPEHPLFTPGNFVWDAPTYYRNYEPSPVMSTYKLSMNILIHLLHRYDDALLLKP